MIMIVRIVVLIVIWSKDSHSKTLVVFRPLSLPLLLRTSTSGLASKHIQWSQRCCYYAPTIDSCPIHTVVDRTPCIKNDHLYLPPSDIFDMLPITSARYSQVIDNKYYYWTRKNTPPFSNWKSQLVPIGALCSRCIPRPRYQHFSFSLSPEMYQIIVSTNCCRGPEKSTPGNSMGLFEDKI